MGLRTSIQASYFSSQLHVVQITSTAAYGHMWPPVKRLGFSLRPLATLATFPKGSHPPDFRLTPPPRQAIRARSVDSETTTSPASVELLDALCLSLLALFYPEFQYLY